MFERYTDRSRRAVLLAQEHARMLHHTEIGTEHLLAGLAAEGEAAAAQALTGLGITADGLRSSLSASRPPGTVPVPGHLRFTREAQRILTDGALREGLQLGFSYVGTEHLLLAVAEDCETHPDSECARMLAACGVTPQEVRRAVLWLLHEYAERLPGVTENG